MSITQRVRARLATNGERGSIPLALLVVIIMAGLTTVMLSRAVAEQRSTRFDNEFTTAVHAGEAGIAEAVFRLNNHLVTSDTASGSGDANGYAYAWQAQRDGYGQWIVTSSGTAPDGVERTVVAELSDRPIFDLALATHIGINFAGGNTADSYHSGLQRRCSTSPDPDCFGVVASNGDIDMGSSGAGANYADRVHLHDWANPANTGPGRCEPTNSVYCDEAFGHRRNLDDPLDISGDIPLVEQLRDACADNAAFSPWRASDVAPANNATAVLDLPAASALTHPDIGAFHCVSELVFDRNTVLASSVTAEDPYFLVVRDSIRVDGHVKVNCAACGASFPASPNMPVAPALQILTVADDGVQGSNVLAAVQIRQHAKLGAAIYAPNASCGNQQGSNAQVEIYGAIVCKAVLNQGGWQFHYDEALIDGLRTGRYFIDRWREE